MATSPTEAKAKMIAGLQEKTGKPLDEWLGILRASGGQTACQEEDRTRQSQEPEIA